MFGADSRQPLVWLLVTAACGPNVELAAETNGDSAGSTSVTSNASATSDADTGSLAASDASTSSPAPDLPPEAVCTPLPGRHPLLGGHADFDGDGRMDFLLDGDDHLTIAWGQPGDCAFEFGPGPALSSLGEGRVLVHDFDGDRRADIVGRHDDLEDAWELGAARNLGQRNFAAPVISRIAGHVQAFIARDDFDIDGDGTPDPLIAGIEDTWSDNLFRPTFDATGAVTSVQRIRVPGYCFVTASTLADFDGDGREDLAISGQWPGCNGNADETPVAIWNGTTTDPSDVDFVTGGYEGWGVVAHDVDGDGREDLVAMFDSTYPLGSNAQVFYGGRDPGFEVDLQADLGLCRLRPVLGWVRGFQSGDIDGDGRSELLAVLGAENRVDCAPDLLDHGVALIDLEAGIVEHVFEDLGPGLLLPLVPHGVHHWVWVEYDEEADESWLRISDLSH